MAKRPNNGGSIRKISENSWEARYYVNGKQRSLNAPTEAECHRKLLDTLQQIRQNEYCEPSQITVERWMRQWWEVYCVPNIRKNSAATARGSMEKHICPAIGKTTLQKLRADHIQALVNSMNRKGLAPSTIKRTMATLNTALKQAVSNQIIMRNPNDNVILPKMKQKEVEFLSQDEQSKLLAALPDTDNGRMIRFMLGTGLRASETIGLRWKDIKGDAFTIRQAITSYSTFDKGKKTALNVDAPKSTASSREIPLTRTMRALLEEQREKQTEQKLKAIGMGIGWDSSDLVFSTAIGSPKDIRNLRRELYKAFDAAALSRRGLHALRHTFATNAIQAGMDVRTLSEIIGHSKIAFTLQIYAHSNMDIKRQALEAMER